MSLSIKDGAIFIADSHYNSNRIDLNDFLNNLDKNITQIFLMGDIFDFLASQTAYFIKENQKLIQTINRLTDTKEVIYFEGNHDFNLEALFPKVKIFTRTQQPVKFTYQNKTVLLCHGDVEIGFWFEFFTFFIRKNYFLKFLNLIDMNHWFTKWVNKKLQNKNIYYEFQDFSKFAQKRIDYFNQFQYDLIIEGHFHQGKQYQNYINLPTFTNNKYLAYLEGKFKFKEI
jgi:UDP-2,3-diacylglucosamine hydrolase